MTRTASTAVRSGWISDIHREFVYPHPRAEVWRALTEPALVAKWLMTPEGFAPVVGNRFVLRAPGKPKGWRGFVECEVLTVDPQRRLRYTWVGDDDGPVLTVTFNLEDAGSGTRLTLDHEGFVGFGGWLLARLMMGPGWSKLLGRRLRSALEGVGERA